MAPAPEAVAYAVKSTADEHGSIPTQPADCRLLAEREGLEPPAEYSDESASAYSGDRGPGLAAALEHAERIKGVLIVQHSDRLARGDGRSARHLAEIDSGAAPDVTLRSVQDDSTFTNPLLAVALGERNAEDSAAQGRRPPRRVSAEPSSAATSPEARCRMALRSSARRTSARFGSTRRGSRSSRLIGELADQGFSNSAISRELHRRGYRTRQGGDWRQAPDPRTCSPTPSTTAGSSGTVARGRRGDQLGSDASGAVDPRGLRPQSRRPERTRLPGCSYGNAGDRPRTTHSLGWRSAAGAWYTGAIRGMRPITSSYGVRTAPGGAPTSAVTSRTPPASVTHPASTQS